MRQCSGLVHWDNSEGWDGEGGVGGIGMGKTCKFMTDSCQCMEKPLQYCKVISLQLIKIKEKKETIVDSTTTVHRVTKSQTGLNDQHFSLLKGILLLLTH